MPTQKQLSVSESSELSDNRITLPVDRISDRGLSKQGFRDNIKQLAFRFGCDWCFSSEPPDLAGLIVAPDQKIEVIDEISKKDWARYSPEHHDLLEDALK